MKIKMHKHIKGLLGAMMFILIISLSNCQYEPAVAVLENQPTLPAQANFEPSEKAQSWTNDNLSSVEAKERKSE